MSHTRARGRHHLHPRLADLLEVDAALANGARIATWVGAVGLIAVPQL